MLHRQIHLPVAQLRVMLHPVFGTLYRKGTNTGSLTALGQLVLPHRYAPRFDVLVQFFLVLQAANYRGKFLRRGPRGSAHHLRQPLPLLVGVADDHAPVVVLARMSAIGVMGCHRWSAVVVDQRRAGPMRAVAGRVASLARPALVHGKVQQRWAVEGNA